MKTIYCVSGAAGHLGRAIIKALSHNQQHIRMLVLPHEKHIPLEAGAIFYGDVTDKASIKPFLSHASEEELIVIHCAGIVSIASSYDQKVVDVNVTGTKNMVDLCIEKKVAQLIYISSVHAIFEKPKGEVITETNVFDPKLVNGLYAKTKAEATAYVLAAKERGLTIKVVHPSGICGPYDYGKGHMTALVIDYMMGKLTSGMAGGYDFVDVRDVADGVLKCAEFGRNGECYILSNRYITIKEILDKLHRFTGKKQIKSMLPLWFVKATAKLAEAYYKLRKTAPLFTEYSISVLESNALFSHEKASKELGYTTRDFNQTLEDTVVWLKDNNRI